MGHVTASTSETEETTNYLAELGSRVRKARAQRGMTRKDLARDSAVSERYLAQLENGQGNISIVLLRQVAHAMNVDIADLVREGEAWPGELHLIIEQLSQLAPDDLDRAHRMVSDLFGTRQGRARRIALIGLRGSGKSTLGRLLADNFSNIFIELATEIERDAGISANEIFSLSGQVGYRRQERRVLEKILQEQSSVVIETGGGLVAEAANYDLLLGSCYTVWLRASPAEHMERVMAQGDTRPMADNKEAMQDLQHILEGRDALYRKADAIVDTSGREVDDCLAELTAICQRARAEGL
ncbi:MAG: helix-turn-helix transcriptional regulator [Alphaproteobacteria bacterium]|nr:helix-turn-helix transcriptional regulator [Alphaproteobacteria bacterium]MBT4020479.1 helix-turn-helix transcriptional regulator [Alphaproteobacteria bacterium]MBT4964988.1 helix-turn-helix transcriptional regulator [Alphaproteobacteria bacterium]MBT5161235.1 helix-turn-helix transcriptional regulator [Alphaproteobacteria bacterium]MBT5918567.1 helix-turn-helix transcriptional regulator [Alphaproteobacteria bacterium]